MLKVLVAPHKTHDVPEAAATDDRELVSFAGLSDAFLVLRTRISDVMVAEVAERDMTLDEYINAFIASYVMAGLPDDAETLSTASSEAIQIHLLARQWPVGTFLRLLGDNVVIEPPEDGNVLHYPCPEPPRSP